MAYGSFIVISADQRCSGNTQQGLHHGPNSAPGVEVLPRRINGLVVGKIYRKPSFFPMRWDFL